MDLQKIPEMFNRALRFAFYMKKLLFTASLLLLAGLVSLFFVALELSLNDPWLKTGLAFFPFFINFGIFLAGAPVMIHTYSEEVAGRGRSLSYLKVALSRFDVIIRAASLAPLLLILYLLLWFFLGFYLILQEIPLIGLFFSAIFAFVPFVIYLLIGLFMVACIAFLFFASPKFHLKKEINVKDLLEIWRGIKVEPFQALLAFFLGIVPKLLLSFLLYFAFRLTLLCCDGGHLPLFTVIHSFMILLPMTVVLAPAVAFFFHFAFEVSEEGTK